MVMNMAFLSVTSSSEPPMWMVMVTMLIGLLLLSFSLPQSPDTLLCMLQELEDGEQVLLVHLQHQGHVFPADVHHLSGPENEKHKTSNSSDLN